MRWNIDEPLWVHATFWLVVAGTLLLTAFSVSGGN